MKERTLSSSEAVEFLEASNKETYKMKGHSFVPLKYTGKQYCKYCGLVALRNRATDWCVDKGCNFELHQEYKNAMRRLTKTL